MLAGYFLITTVTFLIGLLAVSWLKNFSQKHKLLMLQGIPLIGGPAIVLVFLLVIFLVDIFFVRLTQEVRSIIFTAFIVFSCGIIDDFKELSVVFKFLVQILTTALLIIFGVRTHIAYIGGWANIIITFIWVIGITNAFNLLDVMDGLAAGITIIVSAAFFFISLFSGNTQIAFLSAALFGATFAFLIYNLAPAKSYLGNSGSHFLGFIFAAIAVAISYAPMERNLALVSPILILGFPIFDMSFLMFMRIMQGKAVFKKSSDHLALRFLSIGYSKNRALLFMLGLCLFFSVSGIITSMISNLYTVMIIILTIVVSGLVTKKMSGVKIEE